MREVDLLAGTLLTTATAGDEIATAMGQQESAGNLVHDPSGERTYLQFEIRTVGIYSQPLMYK